MESKWENIKEKPGYNIQEVYEEDLEDDVGNKVTIVCMSDTHSTLNEIEHDIPGGDIFIHAGDFTRYGLQSEVEEFNKWLGTLPHQYKVVVAGNHELSFDPDTFEEAQEYMIQAGEDPNIKIDDIKKVLTKCVYF